MSSSTPTKLPNKNKRRSEKGRRPPQRVGSPAGHRDEKCDSVADLTILVHRVDLYDSGHTEDDYHHDGAACTASGHHTPPKVLPYGYEPCTETCDTAGTIAVTRVPTQPSLPTNPLWSQMPVADSQPNPFSPDIDKYWKQRRRLFSRFDDGIQLDDQGWYSVTPEQIADHVATRLVQFTSGKPIIVLDAFGGCGGNSIALAKHPNVKVIAIDIDRTKLRKAAHNASLYHIPPSRLVLMECNALFVLEHCYRHGQFVLDQPVATPEQAEVLMQAMPPPVASETTPAGYLIGGIDVLPPHIDVIFMDPPWGGVNYGVLGKNGYDLARDMRLPRPNNHNNGLDEGFFDTFQPSSVQGKKAQFLSNAEYWDDENSVHGAQLLALAARATAQLVAYDLPRNTHRLSIGQAALSAGYHGNILVEEHYLNGRVKTMTAYFGKDWSYFLEPSP